jgi:hypothetical protein
MIYLIIIGLFLVWLLGIGMIAFGARGLYNRRKQARLSQPSGSAKSILCGKCGAFHDLDRAPDTGVCLKCGGFLKDQTDQISQEEARTKGANEVCRALTDLLQEVENREPHLYRVKKPSGIN